MQKLPDIDPALPERRACDQCRVRKIRCDKDSPCFNCQSTKRSCTSVGVGPRPKESRQRVLISSQYEKKIDRIEGRLASIEALLKDLAVHSSSSQHQGHLPTPQDGSIGAAASTADCDSTDNESAFGGDSAISAHMAFANDFIHHAVRKAPLPQVEPRMEAALANLSQLVEIQKYRSISHGPRFPLQRQIPPEGICSLSMPPMRAVVAALKSVKASPPSMFTSLCALAAIVDFPGLCQKVYFATEEFSESMFLIVNAGLYNLFTEQESWTTDPVRRAECRSHIHLCKSNIDTILTNLPLFLSPKTETVQALLLGAFYAVDMSRPSVAWYLICTAAQLSMTGGFHRSECLSNDPPALAQMKANLFWQIYCLDKGLSLRLGRASTIRDCDINIPRRCDFSGFEALLGVEIPNYWVALGTLQGRIYEELYSPAALAEPKAVIIERAQALAAECSALSAEVGAGRSEMIAGLREMETSRPLQIFLMGDHIQNLVILTLVYRVIPAPEGSATRFCDKCLEAARDAMKVHQETMQSLPELGEYCKLIYYHWNLLLTPYAPYFVLFCYVIETSSDKDLEILKEFVNSLRAARDASETVEKLYRLCQVMYDTAALYVEAKAKQQQDSNMAPIGDEFQMYLSQLGFMPPDDHVMVRPDTSQPGHVGGQAQMADWFLGSQKMIGLLDEDFSQMEGYQWMQQGPM